MTGPVRVSIDDDASIRIAMASDGYLPVGLLKAFYWLDDGLQNFLRSQGWPPLTRTQSMIMMNVISGVDKPAAIARNLGVTRQAVHFTLLQMAEHQFIRLEAAEGDMRSKRVVLTEAVEPMRQYARRAVDLMTDELQQRLGQKDVEAMKRVTHLDWGPVMSFEETPEAPKRRRRKPDEPAIDPAAAPRTKGSAKR